MSESEANRRSLFRLRFPIDEQPCLITELQDYNVIELAENSARLEANGTSLSDDLWTDAVLRLSTGKEIGTRVKLSRIEDEHLIVSIDQNITQKEMMSEQRRLLAKYGKPRRQDNDPQL